MRVKQLNGREINWSPKSCARENPSSYHIEARTLLKSIFPLDSVLEEVSLPGSNGLTADFLIISRKLLVEVHGEQHYDFNSHFYKEPTGLLNSQLRDLRKKEWADLNGFHYIELPYDKRNEWRDRVLRTRKTEE